MSRPFSELRDKMAITQRAKDYLMNQPPLTPVLDMIIGFALEEKLYAERPRGGTMKFYNCHRTTVAKLTDLLNDHASRGWHLEHTRGIGNQQRDGAHLLVIFARNFESLEAFNAYKAERRASRPPAETAMQNTEEAIAARRARIELAINSGGEAQ
jgi:hypothetical protein